MRTLNNRQEIAEAINIKRMTTVRIDLADADEYGLKSQPINIDNGYFDDGTPYFIHSEIRVFKDDKKFVFKSGGCGISSSFTYRDMEDMLTYANAPIVKPDSDIVIAIVDSRIQGAYKPIVMHTSSRVSEFCTTPLRFTDEDNVADIYLDLA